MRKFSALSVAVLLVASSAHAQTPAPTAATLFDQGRAAMAAGDLDVACVRFRESNRLDPQPGAAANLGLCEETRGHFASAWDAYKIAVDGMSKGDTRVPLLRQQIANLETRLPYLVLVLAPSAPKATTVRDDGVVIGTSVTYGAALPFDSGVHHLTVLAPGHASKTVDVTLIDGKTVTLAIEPGPDEAVPLPPVAMASVTTSPSSGPWIVGGIGIAGLVLGAVTGAIVLVNQSTFNASVHKCPEGTCVTTGGGAARDTINMLGPVTTVGLIVGGASVAAGAIWLGVRPSTKTSTKIGVAPVGGGAVWRLEGSW